MYFDKFYFWLGEVFGVCVMNYVIIDVGECFDVGIICFDLCWWVLVGIWEECRVFDVWVCLVWIF